KDPRCRGRGQVLGLAPSAAAAAGLAGQTGIRTDTRANLTRSLQGGELPEWAGAVGPSTLVIIDEAGMADTLSLATTTQDAFTAWVSDQAAGLDAIMLAPTRDLVADLNRRARARRLGSAKVGREVRLADGNDASVGGVILTRTNDRE